MNNPRRKEINKIREELAELVGRLRVIAEEEETYFDNMPESFQDGEKGEKAQTAIELLNSAADSIEELDSELEEATN